MQAAGDARRAFGDISVAPPALAGDDAEIGLGRFAHLSLPIFRRFGIFLLRHSGAMRSIEPGMELVARDSGFASLTRPGTTNKDHAGSTKFGPRFSRLARTASVWLGLPINFCCSTDSAR